MTGPFVLARARSYWREAVIGLLLVSVLVLSMMTCQYRKSGLKPATLRTIDSLAITQPAFDSSQLLRQQVEDTHVAAALELARITARLTAVAAQQRRIADSLASLQQWQAAYNARTREADSLRVAVDSATARATRLSSALAAADARATDERLRRLAVEGLNKRLQNDALDAANCRVAYVIPCVTRTQTFVVGAVLGAAGAYAVLHR